MYKTLIDFWKSRIDKTKLHMHPLQHHFLEGKMPDNYVDLTYDRIIHQTDKAILFEFGDEEVWIPLSQIDPADLPLEDDVGGEVSVQFWLIQEKGLEPYES